MFTGIIECLGKIESIVENGTNRSFTISSPISAELKADQSVSHEGVCLTVEKAGSGKHTVTAIEETLKKTNLNSWQIGNLVNLERCLQMNGRLDGHIVQGHVDTTAICTNVQEKNGSREYSFEFDQQFAALIIEKGSIALNGISLTVFNITEKNFSVAVIPYTYQHTSIQNLAIGKEVNIEFDVLGKYILRKISLS